MRSISEKKLKDLYRKNHSKIETSFMKEFFYGKCAALSDAICECQELQEPWMTLDEFLKSGFIGACWVYTDTEFVYTAYYANDGQFYESDCTECRLDRDTIVHVQPIHKPEPPR